MMAEDAAPPSSQQNRWPVRIGRIEDDPVDDLSGITTPEQRIQMVWDLSARMWELTGRPYPSYQRGEMPGRVVRRP